MLRRPLEANLGFRDTRARKSAGLFALTVALRDGSERLVTLTVGADEGDRISVDGENGVFSHFDVHLFRYSGQHAGLSLLIQVTSGNIDTVDDGFHGARVFSAAESDWLPQRLQLFASTLPV